MTPYSDLTHIMPSYGFSREWKRMVLYLAFYADQERTAAHAAAKEV